MLFSVSGHLFVRSCIHAATIYTLFKNLLFNSLSSLATPSVRKT